MNVFSRLAVLYLCKASVRFFGQCTSFMILGSPLGVSRGFTRHAVCLRTVCAYQRTRALQGDGKHGQVSGKGAAQRDPAQPDTLGGRGQSNRTRSDQA